MDFFITFLFLLCLNLYFSLFLNFNQTNKNLISLILFFIFMSLFIIFYYKFEFLGYAYLLVYVGAIAVLFLFLLISVNIKIESKKIIFNSQSVTFFFLFNFNVIFFYSLFSSIYEKIKNIDISEQFLKCFYTTHTGIINIINDGNPLFFKPNQEVIYWPMTHNKIDKFWTIQDLFFTSYKNNLQSLDEITISRYIDNKITILGDYFLTYNGFFLIVISILLFISIVVSVTICLINEKKIIKKKCL